MTDLLQWVAEQRLATRETGIHVMAGGPVSTAEATDCADSPTRAE